LKLYSFILFVIVGTAILGAFLNLLWFAYGRKKKAEDKAIGVLEQMAHFKTTSSVDATQRRVR